MTELMPVLLSFSWLTINSIFIGTGLSELLHGKLLTLSMLVFLSRKCHPLIRTYCGSDLGPNYFMGESSNFPKS